MPTAGS
ncbi:hypothetical protein NP493_64g02039 [Ridgeia piscesae]|nr:hypothetical protein NP493_64g02039 [Ridgeia piscesae]